MIPSRSTRNRRVAQWSKAYLHHLVRSNEILGAMLMTEHNLWFYQRLMQDLRDAIAEGRLDAYAEAFRGRYERQGLVIGKKYFPLADPVKRVSFE